MPSPRCLTFRVPMADPGDVSGVEALFDSGALSPSEIVAILGKTEGNGCVNDFTRGYATVSLRLLLARRLGVPVENTAHVAMVMSGGVEGGLSPHFLVFAVRQTVDPPGPPALAIGVAATRPFDPWEIGRMARTDLTADAVRQAMVHARIARPEDVHLAQIKCPLLTQVKMNAIAAAGHTAPVEDTYASMGFSRGASALGAAVALGEVSRDALTDSAICQNFGFWSGRASASAGSELEHNEVIVFGNSSVWSGPDTIAHAVMGDAIDVSAVHDALDALGLPAGRQLGPVSRGRIKAAIVKAEPSRDGAIRVWTPMHAPNIGIPACFAPSGLPVGVTSIAGLTDSRLLASAVARAPAIDRKVEARKKRLWAE